MELVYPGLHNALPVYQVYQNNVRQFMLQLHHQYLRLKSLHVELKLFPFFQQQFLLFASVGNNGYDK